MSETGHDLHSEFPNDGAILHELKVNNRHYQTLADRYHVLNKDIARIETGIEAASDPRLEDMKKQRLALLDEVTSLIAQHRNAA
jgi:uncharacterized protein YdcH (DUF465 family)